MAPDQPDSDEGRWDRIDITRLLAGEKLPPSLLDAVETVHEPLARWIAAHRRRVGRCIVVGISGPQGSGKTTASVVLRALLAARGGRVAVMSIDDIYLRKAEREALSREIHPLFATRGPPGTHDIALGVSTLRALRQGMSLPVPAFDKASDERTDQAAWPFFEGPADIVLFEGWCVGARPQEDDALGKPVNVLEAAEDAEGVWRRHVNRALATYETLFAEIDILVQFTAPDFGVVAGWRQEQEAKLREATGEAWAPGIMNDGQVERFVQLYQRITEHVLCEMPPRADAVVAFGTDREPLRITWRCSTAGP